MIRFVAFVLFFAVVVASWSPHGRGHGSGNNAAAATELDDQVIANARNEHGESDASASAATPFANGSRELVIERSPDGHFYTDAQVGAATIHFLVDTGASTIALSPADAQAAGVQYAGSDHVGTAQTAGGQVGLKFVKLDHVAIGPFDAHDVEAAVIDTPMGVSLLGQSWLRQVGTVTISGDRMILK